MFPCEIKESPAQSTLVIRFRSAVQDLPAHFAKVYAEISAYLAELEGAEPQQVFAAYHNMDMQNLDVEAGFTVAKPLPGKGEIRHGVIPSGVYAICHYTGAYSEMPAAWEELMEFTHARGYSPHSMIYYEWYLSDPEVEPQDLKTDLMLPVIRLTERFVL
jgi:effector-binding domain-containing protein